MNLGQPLSVMKGADQVLLYQHTLSNEVIQTDWVSMCAWRICNRSIFSLSRVSLARVWTELCCRASGLKDTKNLSEMPQTVASWPDPELLFNVTAEGVKVDTGPATRAVKKLFSPVWDHRQQWRSQICAVLFESAHTEGDNIWIRKGLFCQSDIQKYCNKNREINIHCRYMKTANCSISLAKFTYFYDLNINESLSFASLKSKRKV